MQKKISIIILMVLSLVLWLFFVFTDKEKPDTPSGDESASGLPVGPGVGDTAPVFFFTSTDGENIDSKLLQGKVIVITSSATWCDSCVFEARQLSQTYKKYKEKDVVFLTISIDPSDTVDLIKQFRQDNDTPWPYADAFGAPELIYDYKLNRFGIIYVIDRSGKIFYKDTSIIGATGLGKILEQLL